MTMLSVDRWRDVPGLVHGFLTRSPGSALIPSGSIDWTAEVADHGVRALRSVVVPRQVHGIHVATVTPDGEQTLPRPEADGVLTASSGLAVGVITADCVPVLLVAAEAGVAAAVHSGWRGTLGGIVPEAVAAVAAAAGASPAALTAAIGPAIGPCCYEVGPEVRSAFEEGWGRDFTAPFFSMPGPRPHLDLRALVRGQLERGGLPPAAIDVVGPCTRCTAEYASARRDGAAAGRQLSFVGWRSR